jgi:hypothetical protein
VRVAGWIGLGLLVLLLLFLWPFLQIALVWFIILA